ncbi:MAG: autotransporter outer membrane beta-barrel domain-containing protein [Candidatus Ruthia sp.]|nr:autotransporter outer membrane beta-barrel domain-containing protein [Candidatus Ruthturnera sp.]
MVYKGGSGAISSYGYDGSNNDSAGGWRSILEGDFGVGNITITGDSSLDAYTTSNITDFDAILVDVGDESDALSADDISKLNTFIATGKRVLLFGENSTWATWNASVESLDAISSDTTVSSGNTSFDTLTSDVSTVTYTAGTSASGSKGTALFGNRVSVLWGDDSNVLTAFDINFHDDTRISNNDNLQYSQNIGDWLFASAVSDSTAPTMTITSSEVSDGGASGDATLSMTFTSNEATTDFVVGDITVGNGTLSSFSATSSTVYTATLTPTAEGEVTVNVAAGTFNDAAGNDNTAATEFNWTYLSNPLNKKDVVASVRAWTDISNRWASSAIDSIASRLSWLDRHKDTTQTSHQGIKIHFEDEIIDTVMSITPRSKASIVAEFGGTNKDTALLQNTQGALVASNNPITSDVSSIVINEAARFREDLIGTLNPTFGTVIDDWSVWTSGELSIGKTDATTNASKQESNSKILSLGFDKKSNTNANNLTGFVLSIGQDDVDIGTSTTNVKSDNYSLSSYGVFEQQNGTIVEAIFGLGHLKFDTIRKDGSDTLTGKRNANQVFASATLRDKTIEYNNWSFSPYGKLTLAHTKINAFSEAGGATALTFDDQNVNEAKVFIGTDANYLITIRNGTIQPFVKLEYEHDISSSSDATMHYNTETTNYTLAVDKKSQSSWKLDLGADLLTKDEWNSSIVYQRRESIDAGYSNSLSVRVGLQF